MALRCSHPVPNFVLGPLLILPFSLTFLLAAARALERFSKLESGHARVTLSALYMAYIRA